MSRSHGGQQLRARCADLLPSGRRISSPFVSFINRIQSHSLSSTLNPPPLLFYLIIIQIRCLPRKTRARQAARPADRSKTCSLPMPSPLARASRSSSLRRLEKVRSEITHTSRFPYFPNGQGTRRLASTISSCLLKKRRATRDLWLSRGNKCSPTTLRSSCRLRSMISSAGRSSGAGLKIS